ncbi:YggS family pyridoxal phosphate-dependent enzyme [Fulvivirgaceae bacterium BMA12]|uniref:Pyridoxal phosphate homeostasis protein n=1 Tax=Agaribacillus aureus TaxID=3051825 RepID=A0ABT8L2U5_9BACT|nr:YggS family pyridoxal phosphate-dependent enzyme [Fulvivirgaceae bacterium BMA12]
MDVKKNIKEFEKILAGTGCRLVAVSKTKPNDLILKAYETGFKDFGENRIQDLVAKYEILPKDINWHMIGHLQSNKVKYIVSFVHLIHAVDSFKLLKEINKQGAKVSRVIPCLLQIHIADETTKFGLDEKELFALIESPEFKELQNVQIKGLMGMATNTDNKNQIRAEFKYLRTLFEKVKNEYQQPGIKMEELSMGMSGDYDIAVEEGSTLIRVGSAIFGARNY